MEVITINSPAELTEHDVFVDGETICLIKNGKPATGRVTAYYDDGAIEFRVHVYSGKRHGLY